MLDNFFSVFSQVVVLFLLICVGYFCGKKKILSDSSAKVLTDIVLYFATPCMIVKSYIREFKYELLSDMFVSLLISLLIHIGFILLATLIFRKKHKQILRFATVFSNAGYMALPLQQAVLGDSGVFLGASYVAIFNILLWTYGILCMQKEGKISIKKVILNPGVLSVIVGIFIFIFSIPLPEIFVSAITHLSNLNTPLPMIIIGFYLSNTSLKELFTSRLNYTVCFVRLVLFPALSLILMFLCGVKGDMLCSMIIAVSAPTAAATTMFSVRYGHDPKISVSAVSLTTLLSLITMPLLVAVALYLG